MLLLLPGWLRSPYRTLSQPSQNPYASSDTLSWQRDGFIFRFCGQLTSAYPSVNFVAATLRGEGYSMHYPLNRTTLPALLVFCLSVFVFARRTPADEHRCPAPLPSGAWA